MPVYTYTAKSDPTKTIQGNIEAESEQDAINKITRLGFFPVSVKPEDLSLDKREGILRLRKVSNKDLLLFTSQLSTLIDSGVNIINGIKIISDQSHNRYLRTVLNDVIGKIKDGRSLSDSLATHPYLFSDLYTAMIHTGEASGNLRVVLKRLNEFFEREEEFKSSLRSSLAYPLFIFVVSILTVVVLLVFVIPRLATMFEDMGQVLPLPTRILIGISGVLRAYWWMVASAIAVMVFWLRRLYRTPQARIALDNFKLKIIIIGRIILKTEISRLVRTLALLLSSGVPITTSLDISVSIIGNEVLKTELRRFKEEIAAGSSLSGALKSSDFFPDFVTNIVAVGEEAGSLEKSLLRIADDYEKEVNDTLKGLTRMLEPVVILVMGLIVGFIVLSMLLPIFQINLIAK